MTIRIERVEHTASDLRRLARQSGDVNQVRRMLAIAMVLEGTSREDAARATGMQRQTLRDWVLRYDAEGVAGLADRTRSGRPRRLTDGLLGELDRIFETGPDVAVDGVVRWRCVDLKGVIATRFGVELSERSVGRVLNERGLCRLSVRPQHPRADEAVQGAFKKNLPAR